MPKRGPLFLKRQTYRRRRLRDLSRLLPVIGGVFFLLPILWSPGASDAPNTAGDGIYLFVIWFALIVIAAVLAPSLAGSTDADGTEDDR